MGGGGGNDSFQQQQTAIEAKKQAARDALNAQFGMAPGKPATPEQQAEALTNPGGGIAGALSAVQQAGEQREAYPGQVATYNAETQQAGDAAKARDQLYSTVRENAFTAGKRKLDEQKTEAQRKLRFELFARGLNGGSEDVNQNAMLGRTYDTGVMDIGAKADGAKAEFRNNDEQTRLGLLQSIDSGMDQGSALSSAINQMSVNSDKAAASAQGTTLGDLFANSGMLYDRYQSSQGQQAGQQQWWQQYRPNTGPGSGKANPAATGLISTTG